MSGKIDGSSGAAPLQERPSGATRLWHLDGLRGWAAFAVLLSHFNDFLYPAALDGTAYPSEAMAWFHGLLRWVWDGTLAVAIFFILSAIVLGSALERAIQAGGASGGPTFVGLTLKRYLRLGLPILASCLLGYLAWHVFTGADFGRMADINGAWAADTMRSCAPCLEPSLWAAIRQGVLEVFLGGKQFYNRVLWTIGIEFLGSLMVFSLVLAVRRRGVRAGIAGAGFVVLHGTHIGLFLFGLVLLDLGISRSRDTNRRALRDLGGCALVACGLAGLSGLKIVPSLEGAELALTGALGMGMEKIQAMLVVTGACLSPTLTAWLSTRLSRFLGQVSFSLYLIHLPLMFLTIFPSFTMLVNAGVDRDLAAFGLLVAVPGFLATAVPFHRFVEEPAIRIAGSAGRWTDAKWHAFRARLTPRRKAA